MLGSDFPPKVNMALETFLRASDLSLLSSVVRNDPKPKMSWLRRGGASWLGMEPNLWFFPLSEVSQPPGCEAFPGPWVGERRSVFPCGASIC